MLECAFSEKIMKILKNFQVLNEKRLLPERHPLTFVVAQKALRNAGKVV